MNLQQSQFIQELAQILQRKQVRIRFQLQNKRSQKRLRKSPMRRLRLKIKISRRNWTTE